jgi:hypothetical protein
LANVQGDGGEASLVHGRSGQSHAVDVYGKRTRQEPVRHRENDLGTPSRRTVREKRQFVGGLV